MKYCQFARLDNEPKRLAFAKVSCVATARHSYLRKIQQKSGAQYDSCRGATTCVPIHEAPKMPFNKGREQIKKGGILQHYAKQQTSRK